MLLVSGISNEKSASVYRWTEVAIAASPLVTARRMRHVIADFDAGPKSGCGKYEGNMRGSNIRTPHPYNGDNGAIWSLVG
jgi:hypothetical protein